MEKGTSKILIVEDHPTNLKILQNLLTKEQYQTGTAASGNEALKILEEEPFDLILLDVIMPGMNGFEVCKIIRSTPEIAEIPIIFLTGQTEEESIVAGFNYGGQDYIKKPFNTSELLARVRTHLQLKEQKKELHLLNESLEQKVAERTKELLAAKEKAELMNELKNNFLANMHHELRTPLIAINGFANLLSDDLEDPNQKYMAEGIARSGVRLMETLNLILDLAQIESETMEFDFSATNLVIETKEILNSYEMEATKKGLTLSATFSDSTIYINTDRRAYRTILNNLVNNAIKFSESGGIAVQVIREKGYVLLKVSDMGIGIPKEFHKLIFEEFRQVSEGFTRNFEGSGLGLSLSKMFVEKFGGQIWVESEPGKGSTFYVKLPVDD